MNPELRTVNILLRSCPYKRLQYEKEPVPPNLPITTQHYILLQRKLLYTTITKAEKLVVLIRTKKALAIARKNNKAQLRYTRLSERALW